MAALISGTIIHYKPYRPSQRAVGPIFTVLHVMQTRYCDENSVCPSVCPSVTRVNCGKTVERSVQIYTPYER